MLLSDYYAPAAEAILDELRRRLPGVAWVGTVGVGVAASGIEYIDEPALVLMVAPLPRESFRLFSGLQPLPAASSGFMAHTALVHAEGSTPDLQELLHELSSRTATGYLFGGLSSARNRPVHMADGVFTGGLSGVAFGPEVGLISRVTQGCQPIGPSRNITQAERNFVVSLDGKPALDCVLQDLGLDRDLPDHELPQALSTTLVGLSTATEDVPKSARKVRRGYTSCGTWWAWNRQHQVLAIADQIEPGMRLAFCTRNPDAAQLDLVRIATEIRDGTGERHGGAHVGRALCQLLGTGRAALRRAACRVADGAKCPRRRAAGGIFRRRRDRKESPLRLHRSIDGLYEPGLRLRTALIFAIARRRSILRLSTRPIRTLP